MRIKEKDDELFDDIESLITSSLQDSGTKVDDEVLDSLCKTIAKTDSCDALKKQADEGDTEAALQVASWYVANAKNILDYCHAYKYAKKAKKGGHIEAYYILGQLAMYGTGCTKNIPRAVRYLSYFIENAEENEASNDSLMADAYAKLAQAEASRGRRGRAFEYYLEANARDRRYDTQLAMLKSEMADTQKGFFFAAVVVATTFLSMCGLFYLFASYCTGDSLYAKYFPWNQEVQVQTIDRD